MTMESLDFESDGLIDCLGFLFVCALLLLSANAMARWKTDDDDLLE